MAALNITEAATVQMPMVLHAAEVGWTPAPIVECAHDGDHTMGCADPRDGRRRPDQHPVPIRQHPDAIALDFGQRSLTGLGVSPTVEPLPLVIHSASSRADRGDYFCPQSGAIDAHAPSRGPCSWTDRMRTGERGPSFSPMLSPAETDSSAPWIWGV